MRLTFEGMQAAMPLWAKAWRNQSARSRDPPAARLRTARLPDAPRRGDDEVGRPVEVVGDLQARALIGRHRFEERLLGVLGDIEPLCPSMQEHDDRH